MEYRTQEQFQDIFESMNDGNWTYAAQKCVEYGFFHHDLRKAYGNLELEAGISGIAKMIDAAWNLGELAEIAQTYRGEKEMESVKG